MTAKLTSKQEMFCLEYLVDMNATKAAIRAGYSEKTAGAMGHENLKKLEISNRLTELMQERCEKTKIDAEWVLIQAVKVHERCMQHEPVLVNGEPTGEFKFEHSGANKALEIIGKHVDVQAFNEKSSSEVTHKVSKSLAERLLGGSKR